MRPLLFFFTPDHRLNVECYHRDVFEQGPEGINGAISPIISQPAVFKNAHDSTLYYGSVHRAVRWDQYRHAFNDSLRHPEGWQREGGHYHI